MNLYMHKYSGETQSFSDWLSDYRAMDAESWFGKDISDISEKEMQDPIGSLVSTGHLILLDSTEMYLDWVNNFLSVDRFAEYYGLSKGKAQRLIQSERPQ